MAFTTRQGIDERVHRSRRVLLRLALPGCLIAVAGGIASITHTSTNDVGDTTHPLRPIGIAIVVAAITAGYCVLYVCRILRDQPSKLESPIDDRVIARPGPVESSPVVAVPGILATSSSEPATKTPLGTLRSTYPDQIDKATAQLQQLSRSPTNPNAWLEELCRRIANGAPADWAATRVPIDWPDSTSSKAPAGM